MAGPKPLSSPVRWRVLQALAGTGKPLGHRELSALTGAPASTVQEVLLRPRRARWVTATHVPTQGPRGWSVRLVYEITDLGREQLAARTTDSPGKSSGR